MSALAAVSRLRRSALPSRRAHQLRLGGSSMQRIALAAVWVLLPMFVTGDFWLSVLIYAGIAAIGAIGLNLLTGYTGQISLGHAFFLGLGAYATAYLSREYGVPLVVWLPASAALAALVGAAVGPFALRLRGDYLAIVSLGLLFFGEHLFRNLRSVTGGNSGIGVEAPAAIGPVKFDALTIGGEAFSRNQGWFWLVWALVAVAVLASANLVRSRFGRALQAVRDRELAAEAMGVRVGRTKVAAFALSGAFAGVAGALLGSYQQFLSPDEWTLALSIQYIAIIIVGGIGTVSGPVIGAVFLGALPGIIERYSASIPFVKTSAASDGLISVFALNQAIYGALIVGFLIFEPRGLQAVFGRVRASVATWPLSR